MTVEPSESPGQQVAQGVANVLIILESPTERAPSLSLAELNELVDPPPTTVRRLLEMLEPLGYVSQGSSGRCLFGRRTLSVAPQSPSGLEVRGQVPPILDELSARTGLNASIGIRHDGRLLCQACVTRKLPRRRYFGVPARMATAYSTAMDAIPLEYRPRNEIGDLV